MRPLAHRYPPAAHGRLPCSPAAIHALAAMRLLARGHPCALAGGLPLARRWPSARSPAAICALAAIRHRHLYARPPAIHLLAAMRLLACRHPPAARRLSLCSWVANAPICQPLSICSPATIRPPRTAPPTCRPRLCESLCLVLSLIRCVSSVLLSIGECALNERHRAYAPHSMWSNMHASPADAVEISKDMRAKRAMAMHWGCVAVPPVFSYSWLTALHRTWTLTSASVCSAVADSNLRAHLRPSTCSNTAIRALPMIHLLACGDLHDCLSACSPATGMEWNGRWCFCLPPSVRSPPGPSVRSPAAISVLLCASAHEAIPIDTVAHCDPRTCPPQPVRSPTVIRTLAQAPPRCTRPCPCSPVAICDVARRLHVHLPHAATSSLFVGHSRLLTLSWQSRMMDCYSQDCTRREHKMGIQTQLHFGYLPDVSTSPSSPSLLTRGRLPRTEQRVLQRVLHRPVCEATPGRPRGSAPPGCPGQRF